MNARATLIEPGTLKMERLLPGPMDRAWAYLTESKKRATWFAGGEFDLRVGGKIEMQFDHATLSSDKVPPEKYKGATRPKFQGAITRLEPGRLLAFTWDMGGMNSEVTFELQPRGKDVLLLVTHRRIERRDMIVSLASGWDVHTGILADVLNGVAPRPFWSTHGNLEKEYAAAL
jgi:uncharacterized protein YndB with AHSA1/START domain